MNENGTHGQVPPLLVEDFSDIRVRDADRYEGWVRLGVLVLAILVFIPTAGSFGLWDCWETHYGEVARYMHETHDFLSPWWGYKEKIGDEAITGEWFFSKPVLIMYGDIIGMRLLGFGDWAIRFSWAILGTLGVFMTYVMISRVFNRRTGLLAAGMLMTAPLFFFLSRQAITDMPFVGTMTIGLLFFINAYFGPRHEPSNRAFFGWLTATLLTFGVIAVPQYFIPFLDLEPTGSFDRYGTVMRWWLLIQKTGFLHTILYLVGTLALLAMIFWPMVREYREGTLLTPERKDFWMRRYSLWMAYTFLALATLGKGLLGFMLPGAILVIYLLLTSEWRALKRLEIPRGLLFLSLAMLPWYLGMFARHGNAFYNRFLVHDHFNRLGAGVHQLDSGTFEHFIKWLAIGTFPWIAFAPLLFWAIARLRLRDGEPRSRTRLFLSIWAFFSYLLFTLSATKFHHYIFPVVPPFIMLTAISVKDFLKDRGWIGRTAAILGLGIMLAVGIWIRSDMQSFRNMFTYKYDRPLPTHMPTDPSAPVDDGTTKTWGESTFYEFTPDWIHSLLQNENLSYQNFLTAFLIVASLSFLAMIFPYKFRRIGLWGLWSASLVLTLWVLNYYMPLLTPSWSQRYLFEDYYKRCTPVANPEDVEDVYEPLLTKVGLGFIPEALGSTGKRVCREDVVAWLITWRGETYYSHSEIKPLMKANQLAPYLEEINRGHRFFALTQSRRSSSLKSALDRETKTLRDKGMEGFENIKSWKVDVVNQESHYFNMVMATPVHDDEQDDSAVPAKDSDRDQKDHEKDDSLPSM